MALLKKQDQTKISNTLLLIIIFLGAALRIVIYIQNRSIILDEANVARNIYEHSFLAFLGPLPYDTFAPPGFLFALKAITNLFGYSEYALRLYSLICSLVSLILLFLILKQIAKEYTGWYTLCLFATGLFFIRYATEVKQYSSDMMFTLSLILLTLKVNIVNTPSLKFILLLGVAGAVTIWFSMPCIFILAGVGGYYLYQSAIVIKSRRKFIATIIVIVIWSTQFIVYFRLLLEEQIHSDYLQSWHKDYFPALIPFSSAEITHSIFLYGSILKCLGGSTVLAILFNLLLFIVGIIHLIKKKTAEGILFATPIICLYIAAGLHHYTLLLRVVLFIMPVILIIMTYGVKVLLNNGSWIRNGLVLVVEVICIVNFSETEYFFQKFEIEDFKTGLNIVQKEKIPSDHFHIGSMVAPVYIYYSKISPLKNRWPDLQNADIMKWNTNYDSLGKTFSNKDAVIYAQMDKEELSKQLNSFRRYASQEKELSFTGGEVFIFRK